ncbi:MAG: HD domain-containing phosphohydrolase [Anaerolineae bacterium]
MTSSSRPRLGLSLGGSRAVDWSGFFTVLAQHTDHEARLDALLELVAASAETPVAALYLADSPESRLHLIRLRYPTPASPGSGRSQSGPRVPFLGGALGGWGQGKADAETFELDETHYSESVISVSAGLPLDLPRQDKYASPSVVPTPIGSLYSVPLIRQETQIGVVQVGPVPDKPGRRLRKAMESVATPLAHAVSLAREQSQLQEQLAAYETRADVSRQMLRSAFELDEFLNLLLELAVKASGTQAGFIALAGGSGAIRLHTAVDLPDGLLDDVDLTPGAGFLEWLDQAEGSLYVADFVRAAELGIQTILAVPLVDEERLLGVLGLMNLSGGQSPAEHSLNLLGIFSEQIQLVLGNVRLFDMFNQRFVDTIHALARALDARYPHSAAHHRRVTDWTVAIGDELGLREHQLQTLHVAGLGHDVGMCGIVEVEHGFQADFHHPTIGASMFEVLPNGQAASEMIATHHEWYDGWGFPAGLKGDEIPIGGRILALAEFITESTTTDSIQTALPPSRLLEEVETRRGRQFDPAVIDAWRAMLERARAQAPAGVPFQPCHQFKGEPDAVCATCPARTAAVACWTIPDVRCVQHGDPDCNGCFVYLEAVERARAAGEEVPAPAPRSL